MQTKVFQTPVDWQKVGMALNVTKSILERLKIYLGQFLNGGTQVTVI